MAKKTIARTPKLTLNNLEPLCLPFPPPAETAVGVPIKWTPWVKSLELENSVLCTAQVGEFGSHVHRSPKHTVLPDDCPWHLWQLLFYSVLVKTDERDIT